MIKLISKHLGQEKLAAVAFLLSAACFAIMGGCSTISFFPTELAQKAADKVIDDIWPASAAAKVPVSMSVSSSDSAAVARPAGTPAK